MNRWLQRWTVALGAILLAVFLATAAIAQVTAQSSENLVQMGGNVTVAPNQVVQNAVAIGGSVTVQKGAQVTATAVAIGGDVNLQSGSRVDGDAYAIGGRVIQEAGAVVNGAINSLPQDQQNYPNVQPGGHIDRIGSPLYVLNILSHLLVVLLSAILGMALFLWRPQFLPSLAATVATFLPQTILWGAGAMVALILLNLFLLISLIGIPLLPLVNLIAFIAMLVGALGVVLLIGQKVLRTAERSPLKQFLIGLLIVAIGGLIPVVGGLFLLTINVLGLGSLLAQQLGKLRPQMSR